MKCTRISEPNQGKFKVNCVMSKSDSIFQDAQPDDGDALETTKTIYIKNEVPECKSEFITIKEEPIDYYQLRRNNFLEDECPSEESLPSTRVARIQNWSNCNRVPQNAPFKPTSKRKREDVDGLVEEAASPITSISVVEENEYSPYSEVVANELWKMNPVQQAIAKKLINKVMLSGALGTLKPDFHVTE